MCLMPAGCLAHCSNASRCCGTPAISLQLDRRYNPYPRGTKGCTSCTHHERGLQCHGPALRPARLGSSQADLRSQGAWAASTGRSCTRKYFSCLRVHADDYTACMFTRPCLVSTIHRGAGGAGKDCICSVRTRLCAKCDMS